MNPTAQDIRSWLILYLHDVAGMWDLIDIRPRWLVANLEHLDIPESPGVYAFYRDGQAVYVGKAASLRKRIWSNHCGQSASMRGSAFRRNVAEHLGIATAADIASRRHRLSQDELATVRSWIEDCEVAWLERPSDQLAISLEQTLKQERKPPLTKL